ncbi:MAG: hypothetical protein AAF682_06075 [Planctomycetota bacterium]
MTPSRDRRLGADGRDVLLAALLGAVFWALTLLVDGALERPPEPGLEPVGIAADPHHAHIGAIYGSFAREAAEGGGLRMHNHQTAEPHPPTMARPWDWLVGRLAPDDGPRGFFRTERAFALVLVPLGCVLLAGELLRSRAARWGALVSLLFGGSLYWIGILAGPGSWFDAHLATWLRAHGGLSGLGFAMPALLLGVPHLALEVATFAGGLGAALRARRTGRMSWAVAAGALLLALASVRPYTAPAALLGAAVALLFGRGRPVRERLLPALVAVGPAVPLLAHYAWVLRGDTIFAALDVVHPAPPLIEQALFFGVPLLLAAALLLPAVRARLRANGGLPGPAAAGLLAALAAVLVVVESPLVAWQVEAMLPLPLFAALAGALAFEGLGPRARWVGALLLAVHLVPAGFYGAEVRRKLASPRSSYWILDGERAALDWLAAARPTDALTADAPPVVLLTEPTFGRLVPWLAGVRVYAGHADHTVAFGEKERRARAFFRYGVGAAELAPAGVTHVLVSPRLGRLEVDFGALAQLELVFERGEVRLYAVVG